MRRIEKGAEHRVHIEPRAEPCTQQERPGKLAVHEERIRRRRPEEAAARSQVHQSPAHARREIRRAEGC